MDWPDLHLRHHFIHGGPDKVNVHCGIPSLERSIERCGQVSVKGCREVRVRKVWLVGHDPDILNSSRLARSKSKSGPSEIAKKLTQGFSRGCAVWRAGAGSPDRAI